MSKLEKFRELGLSEDTLLALEQKGFEEPTDIQKLTIPILLEGKKDVVGQAQTGTGKTAAFGLPMIEAIDPKQPGVKAIVLAPTRELAIQVSEEINSFSGSKRVFSYPIYGGQSIDRQIARLRRGVDIVVGTPGRVIDHIERGTLRIDNLRFFVLDEADEMLSMGFEEDIEKIFEQTNENKQVFLFSATMPPEILSIAKRYMKDHEIMRVAKKDLTASTTEQHYYEVKRHDKFETLCRLIDIESDFYGIIFCRTKNDVDEVANQLMNRGYDSDGLHGDISQAQREKILGKFKNKRINILIATDVAARGIDVNNLTHVVNYSLPQDPESYVHRIGRTGRAGKKGIAITFVTPAEYRKLMFIQKHTKSDIIKQQLPKVRDLIEVKKAKMMEDLTNSMEECGDVNSDYATMASMLLDKYDAKDVISILIKSSYNDPLNKAKYANIEDGKSSRRDRDGRDRDRDRDRGGRDRDRDRERSGRDRDFRDRDRDRDRKRKEDKPQRRSGEMRLFIAKGKLDGMEKRDVVKMLTEKTKVSGNKINDVRVMDKFSFVTVNEKDGSCILEVFKKQKDGRLPLVEEAKK